ncbi:phosphoserine aminotransferase [Algimonas porphyrae]|uniref:phosphoserine transaminase n=2 Tax=Algimonas porphyrae TaxID=1128113 RepID=A0ABQ5UX41_9PROT|nr:phosphoserine transaminase [Algimonas porphyrae]GLQ19856.1 phosphoserine aminotransferase [Algimonas porphyrae]
MTISRPAVKPADPRFSAGPTRKRPGWTLEALSDAALGRSHRSAIGKSKLKQVIDLTREVLQVPDDHRIGIVPASDTGAVEMAMWTMLGPKPVIVAAWENFGQAWIVDADKQLPLDELTLLSADYGKLPDFTAYDGSQDLVFTANGTTSGVKVADYGFIPDDRKGVTICDATSAVYAQDLPWEKLDVVTYSWQKVMGGEAAHGMLILSPKAVKRLESYTPPWPLPKIFRLTKGAPGRQRLIEGIFEGATINTPSLLCAEDHLDALKWVKANGGLQGMHDRADRNARTIWDWVEKRDWIANLCEDDERRSNTGVCLKIVDPRIAALPAGEQAVFAKSIVNLLADEGVALDFGAYRTAPPGFRLWVSGLCEHADVEAILPWLDWAFETKIAEL